MQAQTQARSPVGRSGRSSDEAGEEAGAGDRVHPRAEAFVFSSPSQRNEDRPEATNCSDLTEAADNSGEYSRGGFHRSDVATGE